MRIVPFNREQDFFSIPGDVWIVPVNCVGVMGKGLALACKQRFPYVFYQYQSMCEDVLFPLTPGKAVAISDAGNQFLMLAATKDHWRQPSKLEWIEELIRVEIPILLRQWNCKAPIIPALGCGNGGLPWKEVKALFEKYQDQYPAGTVIIEPGE